MYHFGGPYKKGYSNLGSILGSPYSGKLLFTYTELVDASVLVAVASSSVRVIFAQGVACSVSS